MHNRKTLKFIPFPHLSSIRVMNIHTGMPNTPLLRHNFSEGWGEKKDTTSHYIALAKHECLDSSYPPAQTCEQLGLHLHGNMLGLQLFFKVATHRSNFADMVKSSDTVRIHKYYLR